VERVRPAPQEDRATVAEGPARELLVRRGDPGRAHSALDEAAEEGERFARARGLGKRLPRLVEEPRPVGPERLKHVDHAALVLLALPEITVERRVPLPRLDPPDLGGQLIVG